MWKQRPQRGLRQTERSPRRLCTHTTGPAQTPGQHIPLPGSPSAGRMPRNLVETVVMTEVDVAKLKRLRSAVSSALSAVPEESAHGLPLTYNALRDEVASSVPEGLKAVLERLAPPVKASGVGAHAIMEAARDGAKAYAHLAALKGWLDAVIEEG